ncbi:hypothetical protein BAJUN_00370 [Bajunvirus bajun]|uniref:Band 7 domain-containing protein n=1 Tax=Brevundimonas phage vB_BgoS-Bajun TaxID=2948594 RepID=A0A9E7N731_9CAUD|nr:hypothetical protein BAJUN_00370 [Brevundimonas phage vB_BgoS-Bajun]
MNIKRFLAIGALAAIALTTAACGKTVEAGNGGVKINNLAGGVQERALGSGWHGAMPMVERIEQYPTIQRTYTYTREPDERGAENEEISFTDRTGLAMTADVQIVLAPQLATLPKLYTKYRLTFDQLLDGPIRNDIRTAIAAETEQVGVDQLLAGGRQEIIRRAFARVQRKWAADGIVISQLDWIGAIRFPPVITEAITLRTQADQQVNAANARVAVAEAQAREKIAIATGDAEAYRLRSRELSPAILQQQAIAKWDGKLPTVTGSGATPFINIPAGR